ncbi:MAG: hypothetical protein NTV81_01050 [Candidatus Komeilibacteria bacterium]|nr:hypothetical protein [Candidatus Komeilibacteria bacterium]
METSYFTHYSNDDAPRRGLRKLTFATATASSLPQQCYYWAYSRFTQMPLANLQPQLEEGSLIALKNQTIEARKPQVLWMDAARGIWAANNSRPDKDKNLLFLEGPDDYLIPSDLPLQFHEAFKRAREK